MSYKRGGGGGRWGWDIMAQVFNTSGAKVGGEFVVNSNPYGAQLYPDVVTLENGNFVVAWNGAYTVGGQMYEANGRRIGGNFQINTTGSGSSHVDLVAADDGGFTATWTSG